MNNKIHSTLRLKQTVFAVIGLLLFSSFQNCGQVSFSPTTSSLENGIAGVTTDLPNGNKMFSARALASRSSLPVDMVWVMDNSGSMGDTATIVRSNFEKFAQSVSTVPNLKMALISEIGAEGTSVSIPSSVVIPHLEVNQGVGSRNGLAILASALCPVSGTLSSLCASLQMNSTRGVLNPFFRLNSHKVIVMVTDDSSSVSSAAFLDHFLSVYPNGALSVFGFIGLGASLSPCQASTGQQYMDLASATGGEVYDICATDWSATFAKLASNVVTLGISNIALPVDLLRGRIVAVEVNGHLITNSQYTLTSSGILLDPSLLNAAAAVNLKIEYTP